MVDRVDRQRGIFGSAVQRFSGSTGFSDQRCNGSTDQRGNGSADKRGNNGSAVQRKDGVAERRCSGSAKDGAVREQRISGV